jgi:nucleotide-binding universal stress UspA family protein
MTGVAKISRVLVGVDFDEASLAALKVAASLAAARDAEITVFHAATEAVPAYFTASQIGQLEAEREQSRTAVADQLRTFAERQVPGAVNVVVGEGPPADAIVRMAPAFDLIAVGTHRRHGPRR